MKYIGMILLVLLGIHRAGQDIYVCKNAGVNLYSSAPIEDIEGNSNAGVSVYNASTGEFDFSVPIRSFHFAKSLMEDHFNEDYMESDKYPKAMFKGKMQPMPDLGKDGNYPVTVAGELDVHGVKQVRTITGMVKVKGGNVTMTSEFMVRCEDHHIRVPQLLFHNIAENVRIRVTAAYSLYNNQSR